MLKKSHASIPMIFKDYDTVIYEGAQGLLLSEDNVEYWPNLTPSYTGSKYIADYINGLDNSIDVEVCYVSRGYMTRHGAGKFLTECKREELNPMIIDRINETNKFQGTIRYGYLDLDLLERTIKKGFTILQKKYKIFGRFYST